MHFWDEGEKSLIERQRLCAEKGPKCGSSCWQSLRPLGWRSGLVCTACEPVVHLLQLLVVPQTEGGGVKMQRMAMSNFSLEDNLSVTETWALIILVEFVTLSLCYSAIKHGTTKAAWTAEPQQDPRNLCENWRNLLILHILYTFFYGAIEISIIIRTGLTSEFKDMSASYSVTNNVSITVNLNHSLQ